MFEKIDAWSGKDRNDEPALGFDTILDNVSLYWFTNTGTSSARYYWEVFRTGFGGYSAGLERKRFLLGLEQGESIDTGNLRLELQECSC